MNLRKHIVFFYAENQIVQFPIEKAFPNMYALYSIDIFDMKCSITIIGSF